MNNDKYDLIYKCNYLNQWNDTKIIASKKHKIGYCRLAKCCSKIITNILKETFDDIKHYNTNEIEDDWFLFTFVRHPITLAIGAYSEIEEHSYLKIKNSELADKLNYWKIPIDNPLRFSIFLDELFENKFGVNSEKTFWPAHAYPNAIKLNKVIHKINFIGKVENISQDWKSMLEKSKIDNSIIKTIITFPKYNNKNTLRKENAKRTKINNMIEAKIKKYYEIDYQIFDYK